MIQRHLDVYKLVIGQTTQISNLSVKPKRKEQTRFNRFYNQLIKMIIKFKSQHYLQLCTSWFLTRMFHFFSFSKMGLASEATLAETVVEVTLLLFSCCGTVLANIMVLIVVATKEKLQAPTYFYYLSLAVSDFILGKEVQYWVLLLSFFCFLVFYFSFFLCCGLCFMVHNISVWIYL